MDIFFVIIFWVCALEKMDKINALYLCFILVMAPSFDVMNVFVWYLVTVGFERHVSLKTALHHSLQ